MRSGVTERLGQLQRARVRVQRHRDDHGGDLRLSGEVLLESENPASTYHDIQPWTQDATLVIMWDQGTRLVAPRADICAS